MSIAFSGLMIAVPQQSSALSLQSVRRLATDERWKEAYFNEKSRVVSFVRAGEIEERARINVYYTTGTVGTCLNHPKQGRTQLFRRNVKTLEELRAIFQNPRIHTGKGYQRRSSERQGSSPKRPRLRPKHFPVGSRVYVKGYTNATVETPILHDGRIMVRYDDGAKYHVRPENLEGVMEEVLDEEEAAKGVLEKLKEERVELDRHIAEAQAVVDEAARRRKEEEERIARRRREEEARIAAEKAAEELRLQQERAAQIRAAEIKAIESARCNRGKYIMFRLVQADHVNKYFSAKVTSIACGGNATILLYENGGWSWTAGLPKFLHNKLNGRQAHLPKPTYVALGSQNRYYIKFADGKSEWVGCNAMTELLNTSKRSVATVAFGGSYDSYFVVFDDGFWQCSTIPSGLTDLLGRRNNRGDLKCVSLGPRGEYFLAAKNGRAWWNGLTSEGMKRVASIKDRVQFMDFGDNGTYLVRYT